MINFNLKPVGQSFSRDLADAAKSLGTGERKALVGLLGNIEHAMVTGDTRPLSKLVTGGFGFSPMVLDRMVKILREVTGSIAIVKDKATDVVIGVKIAKVDKREYKDEAGNYFEAAANGLGIFHPIVGGRPAKAFDLNNTVASLVKKLIDNGVTEDQAVTAIRAEYAKKITKNAFDGTPVVDGDLKKLFQAA